VNGGRDGGRSQTKRGAIERSLENLKGRRLVGPSLSRGTEERGGGKDRLGKMSGDRVTFGTEKKAGESV